MTETKAGLQDVVVAQTKITYIDGVRGELIYSGINIHELAEQATFEEVIYLLLHQSLPNRAQLQQLEQQLKDYRKVPQEIFELLRILPKKTDKMAALRSGVSALSAWDDIVGDSLEAQEQRILRLTAQIPILIAAFERLSQGKEPVAPQANLNHSANFLWMLNGEEPSPTAVKALDVALILHADHGFNASTFAARVTVSTLSDVYSAVTSAIGTLKGPLHGGANEQVIKMLLEIGDQDPVAYIQTKLDQKKKIMGFGHRVYKTEDPRATHLRKMSAELCADKHTPWFEISRKIEELIKSQKGLNANVDFYSASVYYTLGIPPEVFTPIFAMSRISGWGAHILEQYRDNRLIRPREDYVGPTNQHYVPLDKRG